MRARAYQPTDATAGAAAKPAVPPPAPAANASGGGLLAEMAEKMKRLNSEDRLAGLAQLDNKVATGGRPLDRSNEDLAPPRTVKLFAATGAGGAWPVGSPYCLGPVSWAAALQWATRSVHGPTRSACRPRRLPQAQRPRAARSRPSCRRAQRREASSR